MAQSRAKKDSVKDSGSKKEMKEWGHWMQGAIKHPGALRETLGIKKGHDIPEKKLEKAAHSKNPLTKKRAIFAETLKMFRNK